MQNPAQLPNLEAHVAVEEWRLDSLAGTSKPPPASQDTQAAASTSQPPTGQPSASQSPADQPSGEASTPTGAAPKPAESEQSWIPKAKAPAPAKMSSWGPRASKLLEAASKAKAGTRVSATLQCAAQESGRFFLEHAGSPNERLRQFIVARCGSSLPATAPITWSWDVPATMSDDAVLAHIESELRSALDKHLQAGPKDVGFWYGRLGNKASAVLISGTRSVELVEGSHLIDKNHRIQLEGTVSVPVEQMIALVNRGDRSVAACERDPNVYLPKFKLECSLAPGDSMAWIEVAILQPKVLSWRPVIQLLAHDNSPETLVWRRQRKHQVPNGARFEEALVEGINRARTAARLPAIELAPEQSKINEKLASHYLKAQLDEDHETLDQLGMSLLAGWHVKKGTIRRGNIFSTYLSGTRDIGDWLDFALDRPLGRSVLLDPEAQQVAVGPWTDERSQTLMAVVTTYAFFDSEKQAENARYLIERLTAARQKAGRSAPTLAQATARVEAQANLVRTSGKPPGAALNDAMRDVQLATNRKAQGFLFEAASLDDIVFPPEVLRPESLEVALAVTHYRVNGGAWGQYVVLMVTPDEGKTNLQ